MACQGRLEKGLYLAYIHGGFSKREYVLLDWLIEWTWVHPRFRLGWRKVHSCRVNLAELARASVMSRSNLSVALRRLVKQRVIRRRRGGGYAPASDWRAWQGPDGLPRFDGSNWFLVDPPGEWQDDEPIGDGEDWESWDQGDTLPDTLRDTAGDTPGPGPSSLDACAGALPNSLRSSISENSESISLSDSSEKSYSGSKPEREIERDFEPSGPQMNPDASEAEPIAPRDPRRATINQTFAVSGPAESARATWPGGPAVAPASDVRPLPGPYEPDVERLDRLVVLVTDCCMQWAVRDLIRYSRLYPSAWFEKAIKRTLMGEKRVYNFAYIRKILDNWAQDPAGPDPGPEDAWPEWLVSPNGTVAPTSPRAAALDAAYAEEIAIQRGEIDPAPAPPPGPAYCPPAQETIARAPFHPGMIREAINRSAEEEREAKRLAEIAEREAARVKDRAIVDYWDSLSDRERQRWLSAAAREPTLATLPALIKPAAQRTAYEASRRADRQ